MRRCVFTISFPVFLLSLGLTARAPAADPDIAQLELLQSKLADVADQVRPSVVAIRAERHLGPGEAPEEDEAPAEPSPHRSPDRAYPAVGSGVILTPDGLILTNEHVIHNADPQNIECVLADGATYAVQGITSDPRSDLAVLRIDGKDLHTAKLGDLSTLRQGHFVLVMGNPFGSASENYGRSAMSFGIVSALGQDLTQKLDLSQQRYYGNLIQTDARINPGNSGGPLLNVRGEVIGITTAISTRSGSSEGVGYAIAIDVRTKDIIHRLMRGEEIAYGFLGVRLDRPSQAERTAAGSPGLIGAVVREVEADTPAARSRLLAGDVVAEFDGQRIEDVDQLIRLVGAAQVNKDIPLVVYRSGQRLRLTVTPARKHVLRGVHLEAPLAWRGMKLADPSTDVRHTFKLPDDVVGVVVVQVEANGSAGKAGLKPGQVIRAVADEPIPGLRRLRELLPRLSGPVKLATTDDNELTLP